MDVKKHQPKGFSSFSQQNHCFWQKSLHKFHIKRYQRLRQCLAIYFDGKTLVKSFFVTHLELGVAEHVVVERRAVEIANIIWL